MSGHCTLVLGLLALGGCTIGPRFGPAETIAAHDAADPTVAVDSARSRVYVAWAQMDRDSSWNVSLAWADRGERFGEPVRVNDLPGDLNSAKEHPPQVVVDAHGIVYVAWTSTRTVPGALREDMGIRLARSGDGGASFSPAVTIAADPTGHPGANLYYDLATASDGALYAIWLDLRAYSDSEAARSARRQAGAAAAAEPPVSEGHVELKVARSADGGQSFASAAVLDTGACICCRTAMATAPDGGVHALWRTVLPGEVRDFITARSTDGAATFAPSVRVHEDGWVLNGCPDIGPDIVVDLRQTVHAAWYTGAPGRVGLWYAYSRDAGGSFSAPVPLLTDRHVPTSEVKLASDGATWVVWEDYRRPPGEIRFAPAGEHRSVSLGNGRLPNIAAGGGLIAVAWVDEGAVRVRVAARVTDD